MFVSDHHHSGAIVRSRDDGVFYMTADSIRSRGVVDLIVERHPRTTRQCVDHHASGPAELRVGDAVDSDVQPGSSEKVIHDRHAHKTSQRRGRPGPAFAVAGWAVMIRIAADGVAPNRVVPVDVDGEEFVLWRADDGHVCSAPRRCPHLDHDLAEGYVDGNELVCAGHGWAFDGAG